MLTTGAEALEQAVREGDEIKERLSHGMQVGTNGD